MNLICKAYAYASILSTTKKKTQTNVEIKLKFKFDRMGNCFISSLNKKFGSQNLIVGKRVLDGKKNEVF